MNVLVVIVMGGLIDWEYFTRGVYWHRDLGALTPHASQAIEVLAMLRSRAFLPDDIYFLYKGDDSPEARQRLALWMAHNRLRHRTGISPLGSRLLFTSGLQGSSAAVLHRVGATHAVAHRFELEELAVLNRAYAFMPNHPLQSGLSPKLRIVRNWNDVQHDLLPHARSDSELHFASDLQRQAASA